MFILNRIFLPQGNTFMMAQRIPLDRKQKLLPFIKENFGKISQREIARRIGVGKTTINTWTKELGLFHKKHTVNESFFDEFNEESSYTLGLIYADGNIAWNPTKGYQALTITTSAKDKEHLEKLRLLMSSTKSLLYSSSTNSYRLIVNNKNLVLRLMELGVFPRKSLTIKFPDFLPTKMMSHFLRGVIDGDGCVYYLNRKRSPYFSIRIYSGSPHFLYKLAQFVEKNYDISGKVNLVNPSTFGVEYTCSRAKKLGRIIYQDFNISLERKYKIYKDNVLGGKLK